MRGKGWRETGHAESCGPLRGFGYCGVERRYFMPPVRVSKTLCGCCIENRMWWTDREAQTLDGAITVTLRSGDASLDPAVAVK